MGWLSRGAGGLALMLAGVCAFLLGVYHLTGTGTDAWVAALAGGLFLFLAGGAVIATRETRAMLK